MYLGQRFHIEYPLHALRSPRTIGIVSVYRGLGCRGLLVVTLSIIFVIVALVGLLIAVVGQDEIVVINACHSERHK
jgi:hypothetical protein